MARSSRPARGNGFQLRDALYTRLQAVDAAHAAGARVAVHSNLPDSGLAAIGADSIEHGTALSHSEIEALGARGGAYSSSTAGAPSITSP
jgi:imidazolonepropionase-like amidohydrolase